MLPFQICASEHYFFFVVLYSCCSCCWGWLFCIWEIERKRTAMKQAPIIIIKKRCNDGKNANLFSMRSQFIETGWILELESNDEMRPARYFLCSCFVLNALGPLLFNFNNVIWLDSIWYVDVDVANGNAAIRSNTSFFCHWVFYFFCERILSLRTNVPSLWFSGIGIDSLKCEIVVCFGFCYFLARD